MAKRFQFSLRALLGLLTLAAVLAWGTTIIGVEGIGIALLLMTPLFVGVMVRKPLEGCLANAFFIVVLMMGGFIVAALLAE